MYCTFLRSKGKNELLDDETTFLLLRLVNTPLVTAASKGIGQICPEEWTRI